MKKTEIASQRWTSWEELRDNTVFELETGSLDPHHESIAQEIQENRQSIIDACPDELWRAVFATYEDVGEYEQISHMLADDRFIYECHHIICNETRVSITIYNRNWFEKRTKEVDELLDEDMLLSDNGDMQLFHPEKIAAKLDIEAQREFKIVKDDFDPSIIGDRLGRGIDGRIMELVRQLNMLGIETESSCGGHRSDYEPYLRFSFTEFNKVIALLLAWQNAGGSTYGIERRGGYTVPAFDLRRATAKSIAEQQADIDKWTDFLAEKIEGYEDVKLSLPEFIHKKRRWLKNLLRRKA